MNDLISVVIPVYNVEKYINECLESILNQTYKNLEIILVDDGTKDNCDKICDQYALKDKRIKVIHKKNGGLSDARNKGIEQATGKYITFIDSDDSVTIDYIEYLYNLIKKSDTDISICAHTVIAPQKNINFGKNYTDKILTKEECLKRMLCEEGFSVSAWAKMYKLDLFNNISFPKAKLCEDNGTTYKLIDKCTKISYGHESKYNYYRRAGSIMKSNFNLKKIDLIELSDEMCNYLEKYKSLESAINKKRFTCRCSILRQISESKNDKNYKELIKKIQLEIKRINLKGNKLLTTRDKVALYSLKLGYLPFKTIWKLYSILRYGE